MEKRTSNGLHWEEYIYDQLDRILTKSTPDGITEYTYDRNGNQLTKFEDEKEEIQTYDALNRLISWTDGSKTAEYTYYPDNNRASKMVDGVTTRHIWSGGEIQVDITEGKTVNYIHGHRLIESDYGTYLYNAPASEYLNKARKFIDDSPNQLIRSFTSSEGTYFEYHVGINEFGILNKFGGISTYFKPDEGINYWINQISQYSPK